MEPDCAKCGSSKIIPQANVQDQGQYSDRKLKAFVSTRPKSWFLKGNVHSPLLARICGSCGYTELYAQNPGNLYRAYRSVEK